MKGPTRRRYLFSLAAACFSLAVAAQAQLKGQAPVGSLDSYYYSPVETGGGYSSYSAFSGFASGFQYRDISAELRIPLPSMPSLQPLVRGGLIAVSQLGASSPSPWDHSLYHAEAGLGYSIRYAKNFEIGADLAGGIGQSSFPSLVSGGAAGSLDLLAEAGLRIALIPSFNFSLELKPGVMYRRSLGPLDEFDGFSYGIGLTALWRIGDDPDAPAGAVRSLAFPSSNLPPAFAAMQGYYSRNPLGTIEMTNSERVPLTDIEVSFFQPGYMDSPTTVATFASLAPGASMKVGILAAFNREVFKTEGMTPLAGTLSVKYRLRGKAVEQVQGLSYDLYDRTSITWDDDRKVGAFITPADSALRNYVSYLRKTLQPDTLPFLPAPLQTATEVFSGLSALGLLYQADPSSPFVRAQGNPVLVDSINVGRDTLVRGTGDCDDLTVLFASLLETTGVQTGFVTVPGHIFPVVNSLVPSGSWRDLATDRSLGIPIDGQLWFPVEVTLVGKQGFFDAWRKGAELWHEYDSDPTKRNLTRTAKAQELFGPVTLTESDLGLQYGSREVLSAAFKQELARMGDSFIADLNAAAKASKDKRDWNALGLAYIRFGRFKDAEAAFTRATKIDPAFASALVNLGNIAYLQRDYKGALGFYQGASNSLASQGRGSSAAQQAVLVNISKSWAGLKNFGEAKAAFAKADAIDPGRLKDFAYLATSDQGGKAAEQSDLPLTIDE